MAWRTSISTACWAIPACNERVDRMLPDPGCITIAARCCQRNHYSRLLCSLYTCQRGRRYFPFGIKKCSINIDHKQLNTCWRCFHTIKTNHLALLKSAFRCNDDATGQRYPSHVPWSGVYVHYMRWVGYSQEVRREKGAHAIIDMSALRSSGTSHHVPKA